MIIRKLRMGVFPILLICYFFTNSEAIAQNFKPKITATFGVTWRSTAMNFFNFNHVDTNGFIPVYIYERNVQGLGINPGFIYQLTSNVSFEYYPNIRYDQITFNRDTVGFMRTVIGSSRGDTVIYQPIYEETPNKEFILDHNINIILRKRLDWGLGLSLINTGKSFQYENPIGSPPKTQNIQFITYNIFILIPVKDIFELELKALYTENLPTADPNEDHIMYSVRVLYKLNKKAHNR